MQCGMRGAWGLFENVLTAAGALARSLPTKNVGSVSSQPAAPDLVGVSDEGFAPQDRPFFWTQEGVALPNTACLETITDATDGVFDESLRQDGPSAANAARVAAGAVAQGGLTARVLSDLLERETLRYPRGFSFEE